MDEQMMHEPKDQTSGARRARQRTILGATVILLAGIAVGSLLTRATDPPPAKTVAAEAPPSSDQPSLPEGTVEIGTDAQRNAGVKIGTVSAATLPVTIDATGAVAPEESKVAHIRPLARGVVEDVAVSLGARVKKGQPLLTLDNIALGELIGEYLAGKAALTQAQTQLDVQRTTLARAEALIKIEAIAQQELDIRRAEFKNAEASVASQRAQVAKVEEQIHRFGLSDDDLARLAPNEGQDGHRTASHNILRAPFDGIITKYDVAEGETVEPDRELFTVADLSTVWVLADVYEQDLGRMARGSDVTLSVATYPDRTFTGLLTYISDVIDPKTRTAKVRCVVANPDAALKLDMFARVSIPTRDRRQAVAIPQTSVQQIDNRPVVFVRQSATRFERRHVELGARADGSVEVLSGLKPGERIVTDGSFYFKTALLRERIGE